MSCDTDLSLIQSGDCCESDGTTCELSPYTHGSRENRVSPHPWPLPQALYNAHVSLSRLIWTLFVVFTLFHLLANHRAVSVVTMETLNQERLHLLMSMYLTTGVVPTVDKVNAREPILSSIIIIVTSIPPSLPLIHLLP